MTSTADPPAEARALLAHWFGNDDLTGVSDARRDIWFRSTPEFDAILSDSFAATYRRAAANGCDGWQDSPSGALALVVLLDQVPRNIFRGSAMAYATDARARAVAERAIGRGFDKALAPLRRSFLYLPFEHSEALVDQFRSVALFRSLPEHPGRELALDFAIKHLYIIERFGRFPHRNTELGRPDTSAERAFLDTHGRGF